MTVLGWKEFGPKELRLLAAVRDALTLLDTRPRDPDWTAKRGELYAAAASVVATGEPR
jgi:hypothetical protein